MSLSIGLVCKFRTLVLLVTGGLRLFSPGSGRCQAEGVLTVFYPCAGQNLGEAELINQQSVAWYSSQPAQKVNLLC